MSFTFAREITICWGSKTKCIFPVIIPHRNIDSAILSEYSSIGWSLKALLSRSLANVLCSRAHPCIADGTCNNLAFGKYRHDICQNKYMSRFSGRKFYTLKASKLIFSLTKQRRCIDVSELGPFCLNWLECVIYQQFQRKKHIKCV